MGRYISLCLRSKHRYFTNFDMSFFQAMLGMTRDLETSRGNDFYTARTKSDLRVKKEKYFLEVYTT